MVAHVFISGFVQGVGFRQFIKNSARKIGLAGWVRNLDDGRVEAVFSGSKESIEETISICKKGPFLSEVKEVEVMWEKNLPAGGENYQLIAECDEPEQDRMWRAGPPPGGLESNELVFRDHLCPLTRPV